MNRFRAKLLLLAVLLLPSACAGDGEGSEAGDAPDPDAPGVHEVAPGRYEATIWTYNWGFDPAEIRLRQGRI